MDPEGWRGMGRDGEGEEDGEDGEGWRELERDGEGWEE